jgi:hypothetical protein
VWFRSFRVKLSVRDAKARSSSWCESDPATIAPASSNRSSCTRSEATEAFGVEGHAGDLASMQAVSKLAKELDPNRADGIKVTKVEGFNSHRPSAAASPSGVGSIKRSQPDKSIAHSSLRARPACCSAWLRPFRRNLAMRVHGRALNAGRGCSR